MALDLHVAGPGLELSRRLRPGDPPLVLGRDADCAICLPDPERNVSRRHLSVWNEADALHFQVLSIVNGVDLPAGEVPPGARGVLAPGEPLVLSAFRLTVSLVPAAAAGEPDPWTEFQRQTAELLPPAATIEEVPPEDDPFGDWGFSTTFGPGAPGGSLDADALAPATDLRPFLAGLGLQPAGAVLTQGELETIGRLTRIALQGLVQAQQASAASRAELQAADRTMMEPREANPLRMDLGLEDKLRYLFGGQAAGVGFMAPDRAVAQVVADLLAHHQAMGEATRRTVEGVLEEFAPDALRTRLLGGGPRLFESARAWDAFARDYAQRRADLPAWVQQLMDRHFGEAYVLALLRAKRDTGGRRKG
jgi:predicted component of type VI protein secretion system